MIEGFKIGFMPTGSLAKIPIDDTCDILKRIGYDAVEWPISVLCPNTNNVRVLDDIMKRTKSHDLAVSEVVVQQDYVVADHESRQRNINYTTRCIETLSSVGVKVINLYTGPVPWNKNPVRLGQDMDQGRAWDMVFRAFDQFVPLAEKHHIYLAIENVWGMLCSDFYTAWYLINHYRSPYLGVNYDPSHDILAGNNDIGWIIRQWGADQIFHIHLKDAAGTTEKGRFVFPLIGEGHVNWCSFFSTLREIGYSNYASVEFESFSYLKAILNNDMGAAAALSYDLLKKVIPKHVP
jgi:sugar phosphate isomerase/epimerase